MTVRIAVIWGTHRNDAPFHTHHSYWEATIKERPEFSLTRFTWNELGDIPRTYDLYLFLDFHPSLYILPRLGLKNTAIYWWDSFHFPLVITLQAAELVDRAYFAEYLSASQARGYGVNAFWLPSAFYPGVFRPLPERKKVHQYGFVGNPDDTVWRNGDTRLSFLAKLGKEHLHGYVGNREILGDPVNTMYNESEVLFDRTIFSIVGTRFFETVGSGGFVLMNRLRIPNGIEHLAQDGVHYVSYDDSFRDFRHKLLHYLEHPEERLPIVEAGTKFFHERHTYSRRLDRILLDFGLIP